MKDKLIGFMLLPLFAGAAMAVEPQTVVSIENEDSYLVDSGSYISASGYYYKDASGYIHRGPVYNVGEFTIDGIFESKYTGQHQSQWILMKDAALDKDPQSIIFKVFIAVG